VVDSFPLLFLDVDGPLIPFGLPPGQYATYPGPCDDGSNPGLARLDPGLGPRLAALPCELVWATSWGHDANGLVAPRLGLPSLDVVDWPDQPAAEEEQDARIGLHWKTRPLIRHAAGRPFAWADDEITGIDREWARAYHPGPALLHRVDPRHGLAEADFAALAQWLTNPIGLREQSEAARRRYPRHPDEGSGLK
jgi:hypothetical protein